MGYVDDVTSKFGGHGRGQEGGLATLSTFLSENGGLQGLTSRLFNSGLGHQVHSWVGSGDNQPVRGSDVQQAVDPQSLEQLALQTGTTPEQASENVAMVLPQMVNEATPDGKVPADDPFAKGMDALQRMLSK